MQKGEIFDNNILKNEYMVQSSLLTGKKDNWNSFCDIICQKLRIYSKQMNWGDVYIEKDPDEVFEKVFVVKVKQRMIGEAFDKWNAMLDDLNDYCNTHGLSDYFHEVVIIYEW